MERFEKLGLGKGIIEVIRELGFEKPSEIQEKTIPLVIEGRDVIGQAATGSGKTLAFGAGIISQTIKGHGIQSLVLTPTRELAEQVSNAIKRFAKHYDLDITEVYGGVSINPQISRLERAEIVVGTPGRILDHINRRTIDLRKVKLLVLDEADRMVDMGFLPDVEKIVQACPRNRQTLLFSATISQDIEYVSKKYMNNPIQILVKSYIDASKLRQVYYDVQPYEKFSLFVHLLKNDQSTLVMVFCNTRGNVEHLTHNLSKLGFNVMGIHGGMNQNKRNNVMEDFHKQNAHVLVCTDVAARGLDIKNVTHIYNYDIPKTSTDYIHRIGRTARAGKEGEAVSIVCNRDYENFRKVLEDSAIKIEQKDLPEFPKLMANFSERRERSFGGHERNYSRSGTRRYGTYKTGGPSSRFGRDSGRRDSSGSRDGGEGRRFSGDRGGGGGRRSFGGRRGDGRSFGRRDSGRDSGRRSEGRRDNRDSRRSFGGRRSFGRR